MKIVAYKDKHGKTKYKFNAYLGTDPMTGKDIRTNRQGFKTKKEAQIAYVYLKEHGLDEMTEHYTFEAVTDIWLKQYKLTVKDVTYKRTRRQLEMYILPAVGKYRIRKITLEHCQDVVNKHAKDFVNNKFLKQLLSKVLEHAVKLGIIEKNPAKYIVLPKAKKSAKAGVDNFYDKGELLEFLKCVKNRLDLQWYTYFYTLAFTGLRKAEVLALHWSDIDFKGKTITSDKTVSEGGVITSTKTDIKKVIDIDNSLIAVLKAYKANQVPYLKNDIIFRNTKNTYTCLSKPDHKLKAIYKSYPDLKQITLHGFRHTHCSLLFEAGASLKEVQDRLGHSDIKTTMNIYAHVTKNKKKEVANKFSNYLLG